MNAVRRLASSWLCIAVFLMPLCGCGRSAPAPGSDPSKPNSPQDDLFVVRKGFATKLTVRGPAPQDFDDERPPPGVNEVKYSSGDLQLKGWLSAAPADGQKRPAVVFLHGGFSFGAQDWQDASPFVDAGFVLFTPMLRGENGNPGFYESFYGEVDDAIAAGRYVAALPYVDEKNVFVAGHSVGAVLTCLTAMMPSPYKAAAAFDGYYDMDTWVAQSERGEVPYDPSNREEIRVRNPMAFAGSFRCPLTLFTTREVRPLCDTLVANAVRMGKTCEVVVVPGDHHTMVRPAIAQAIERFRRAAQ